MDHAAESSRAMLFGPSLTQDQQILSLSEHIAQLKALLLELEETNAQLNARLLQLEASVSKDSQN